MSTHHLRADKTCLNCGTHVPDRFCPHCGQENLEPKESVGHLLTHFINDITHFDGKFFSTIKVLFTKPGFLSAEYMKGRRAAYLNPIRMFLFISFALFFAELATYDYTEAIHKEKEHTAQNHDSLKITNADSVADSKIDIAHVDTLEEGVYVGNGDISFSDSSYWLNKEVNTYKTVHEYDSAQNILPKEKRYKAWQSWVIRRVIGYNEYADEHPSTYDDDFAKAALHSMPKALFLSIPIFALILWLLYIRSRKNYYFVAHAIFIIHIYCAVYLFILITIPLDFVVNPVVQSFYGIIIWLLPAIYLYLAMKRFYGQNHFKTAIKFLLMAVCSLIVLGFFILGIALNTMYQFSQGGSH